MNEYKLISLGKLKYNRTKSMLILKNELNSFGYSYTNIEIKELLDNLLLGNIDDITYQLKNGVDLIFDDNNYEEIMRDNEVFYGQFCDFPENWIPPTGSN